MRAFQGGDIRLNDEFDACIDLCGNWSSAAAVAVREAVEALQGANWISVECCGTLPSFEEAIAQMDPGRWIRVWRRGSCAKPEGEQWKLIRGRVRVTALAALATLRD